jgi:hypothetical protein
LLQVRRWHDKMFFLPLRGEGKITYLFLEN